MRIARQALNPPQSRPISQDSLQKWEKSATEASLICNQAARFNHCLFKVQQGMQEQLKAIWTEGKGKSVSKVAMASDELQFLMDFNASISQAMAKTMEHLSDFVFVSMTNLTLLRRDSYLSHMRTGIKPDTLACTENCSSATLYPLPPTVCLRSPRRTFQTMTIRVDLEHTRRVGITLMNVQTKDWTLRDLTNWPGKTSAHTRAREVKGRLHFIHPDRPRQQSCK